MWQLLTDGELWPNLAASGYEIGLGAVLGVLPALAFGLLASLHPYTRRVFQPLIALAAAINWLMTLLAARSVTTRARSNVTGFFA
ncbi:MAG TPA: hypothetical protein VIR57_10850 [Chloroflexota bacterium]